MDSYYSNRCCHSFLASSERTSDSDCACMTIDISVNSTWNEKMQRQYEKLTDFSRQWELNFGHPQ